MSLCRLAGVLRQVSHPFWHPSNPLAGLTPAVDGVSGYSTLGLSDHYAKPWPSVDCAAASFAAFGCTGLTTGCPFESAGSERDPRKITPCSGGTAGVDEPIFRNSGGMSSGFGHSTFALGVELARTTGHSLEDYVESVDDKHAQPGLCIGVDDVDFAQYCSLAAVTPFSSCRTSPEDDLGVSGLDS